MDKKGRPLAPSEKQSALTETTFQYTPKSITGYVTPQAFEVKVDKDSSHTFIYQKVLVPRTITLHFVDDKGQTLAPSQRLVRNEEENLSYTAPSRENYVTPTPLVLTVDKDSSHTFVYQKIHRATFLYRDQDGRQVKDSEQVTGVTGTKVAKTVEALEGYRSPASFETTLAGDVTHTFVYQKIYHITFQYRDEAGRLLKNDETVSGIKGELAKKNPDLLWGYDRPVAVEFPITGDGVYTFTYHRKGGIVPIRPTAPAVSVPVRAQVQPVIPTSPAIIYRPQIRANTNWSIGRVQPTQPKLSYPQAKPIQPAPKPAIKPAIPYKTESLWGRQSWFSINTGFSMADEKNVKDFLYNLEKEAKKKYGNNQGKITQYVTQGLAYRSYSNDRLQPLINHFYNPSEVKGALNTFDILHKNHINSFSPTDFAHTMTGLASLENQGLSTQTLIKYTGVIPPTTNPYFLTLLGRFNILNNHKIISQLNSLTGDLYTHSSKKDVVSDMDTIILSRHPKYKELPIVERILSYYEQKDLEKQRQRLLLEVYDTNSTIAKVKLLGEIAHSSATIGGLALMLYGFVNRKGIKGFLNGLKENMGYMDDVVFNGSIKEFTQDPIGKTISVGKNISSHIINSTIKGFQDNLNKVKNLVIKTKKKLENMFNSGKELFNRLLGLDKKVLPKRNSNSTNQVSKISAKVSDKRAIHGRFRTPFSGVRGSQGVVQNYSKVNHTNRSISKPTYRNSSATLFRQQVVPTMRKIMAPITRYIPQPIKKAFHATVSIVKNIFKPKSTPKKSSKRRR